MSTSAPSATSSSHLAQRLAPVRGVHLVAASVAEGRARSRPPRGTGRRTRTRTSPRRRRSARPKPSPSSAADRADAAVHHVARRDDVGPASAWLRAVLRDQLERHVVHTSPSRTRPQCPCVVYSQRQTSVTRRDRVTRFAARARPLDDALVVVRPRADLVLLLGNAEEEHGRHRGAFARLGLRGVDGARDAGKPVGGRRCRSPG